VRKNMTATVPEDPRKGSYLPVYAHVDVEGGGDLHANTKECTTCHAMVAEAGYDVHMGRHETEGGGSEPKSR
jgi:hypothetical protein